jgi:hypothetical protein
VAQRGEEVEISFQAPRTATDKDRLGLMEVEIMRVEGTGDFTKTAQHIKLVVAPGEQVSRREPAPPEGTLLRFAARAIAKNRPSLLTSMVSLTVQDPPEAPSGLVAQSSREGAALSWNAPRHMPKPPKPKPSPSPSPAASASPGASPSPGTPANPNAGESPSPSQAESAVPWPSPVVSPSPAVTPQPAVSPSPVPPSSPGMLRASGPSASGKSPSPGPSPSQGGASPSAGVSPSPSPSPTPTPITTGFYVYRKEKLGGYGRPLQPIPLQTAVYSDTTAAPGTSYCYVVATVASTDPVVESERSNEVCLDVADVTPPAPPLGLAVLAKAKGLEISWSPSPEADLAVYRLYRSVRGEKPVRVVEIPAGVTTYIDGDVKSGVLYVYTLSALDASGNESPPSRAAQGSLP